MTEEPSPDATPASPGGFVPRTSPLAVWCFIFGLLSFLLPVVFSVRAIVLGMFAMAELKRTQDPRSGYGWATTGIACGWITLLCCGGCLGAGPLLEMLERRIKSHSPLSDTVHQSRNFVMALRDYETQHGSLPVIAPTGTAPGLSWRVHILPYIGHGELYNQFHLNEPWSSPHNQLLIPKMPNEFQRYDSNLPQQSGRTCFQLVIGPGSMFDPVNGRPSLTPPNKTTVLVVITDDAHAVTWTAPQDYNRSLAPVGLWTRRFGGTVVAHSDGGANTRDVKSPADLSGWDELPAQRNQK